MINEKQQRHSKIQGDESPCPANQQGVSTPCFNWHKIQGDESPCPANQQGVSTPCFNWHKSLRGTKQSGQNVNSLDCFASLAMTEKMSESGFIELRIKN
jgi:hypothetical protein